MSDSILTPIHMPSAPRPRGADSQAVRVGPLIFVPGQGPCDLATGAVVGTTVGEQVRQTMANVKAILAAAGASLAHVARITAYFAHEDGYPEYDHTYAEFFPATKPARSTVQAGTREVLVEIAAIAYLPAT